MSNRKHRKDPSPLLRHLPTDNCAQLRSVDHNYLCSKNGQILDLENPEKDEADFSIESSTGTTASLNRSRDSGFSQEGTSEFLTSSFHFDNFLSKNRSRAEPGEGNKTCGKASGGQRFESFQDYERPNSMNYFEKWSSKNQCLQKADSSFTKQPINSYIRNSTSKNRKFPSGVEIFPHSDNLKNEIQTNPTISTSFPKRASEKPSTKHCFDHIAGKIIYQNETLTGVPDKCNSGEDDTSFRGTQRLERDCSLSTIRKLLPTTDELDYSPKIISRNFHTPINGNYNYETNILEKEGTTFNQWPTEEFNISVEKEKSRHLRNNGGTRKLQTSETDFPNSSVVINDDLKASSESSIQESVFDMFGAKLSDVCRQLLLSDYTSQVDSSRTDPLHDCEKAEKPRNIASQSVSSLPLLSPDASLKEFCGETPVVIDHSEISSASGEEIKPKHSINNSKPLDNLVMKSKTLDFSLKVDRQPIWSMAPAPPAISGNESYKKGDQVPFYCKFSRREKDDANHVRSIDGTSIRLKQMIDFEKINVADEIVFDNLPQSVVLGSKASKEPQKIMNGFIANNNSNLDDAKLLIETKQTPKLESERQSHSAKTYKISKRFSRSPRERSVSRRRRGYLHEISLEIIKTIEEELRISHRWNGVSPSETIARRIDRILSNHHRERVNLGLTEPFNQEQYNFLIDTIALQDRDYSYHRSPSALPYRSLSPPPSIENVLSEGFNLEERLALLLRCGQIDSAEGKNSEFREDYDLFRAMETNASLHLPRMHLEESSSKHYQSTINKLPAQRSDFNSHLVDRVSLSTSSKNETTYCSEAKPKTLKKTNVMQTKIPLNDKVLEIVLNVSENESNNASNANLPNKPTSELTKKDFSDCSTTRGDNSNIPRDEKNFIDISNSVVIMSKTQYSDRKKEHNEMESSINKGLTVVATELEEAKPSIVFKILAPSSNFSDADSEIIQSKSCENDIEVGIRSADLNEILTKDDLPEFKKETNLIESGLSDNDDAFEAEIASQSASTSKKSYFSLDLGNKFKTFPQRKIKIMLSSSDAGDNCSTVTPLPHQLSVNNLESQAECLLSVENLSDNNNIKTTRQNLSSSDDLIFGTGTCKKNDNNADKMDQIKIRKRVTFNRDLVISPSDLTGVRKYSSDKTILVNKDSHASSTSLESKRKNELNENSDSINPNQVIMVNKFLNFSGNGPIETSIFQTHSNQQDHSNSINSNELSPSKDNALGIPMSFKPGTTNLKMPGDNKVTEAKESLDSLQLMMSGEPSEIDPGYSNQKISAMKTIASMPSPPRLLRKLNAVRVTDFGAARGILRKAFKDRAFGKAFDDGDVAALRSKSSYGVNKRKQKRTKNEVPEKERILTNVEVQTELDFANKETQNISRSSRFSQSWFREASFSFPSKLGLAIFVVAMAVLVFYFIVDSMSLSSSAFDGRKSPLSAAFSME